MEASQSGERDTVARLPGRIISCVYMVVFVIFYGVLYFCRAFFRSVVVFVLFLLFDRLVWFVFLKVHGKAERELQLLSDNLKNLLEKVDTANVVLRQTKGM